MSEKSIIIIGSDQQVMQLDSNAGKDRADSAGNITISDMIKAAVNEFGEKKQETTTNISHTKTNNSDTNDKTQNLNSKMNNGIELSNDHDSKPRRGETPVNINNGANTSNHGDDEDEELLKPLWIATFVTKHPCKVCWCIVVLMLLLGFVDSFVFELSETSSRTWFVEDDETVIEYDSWTLAEEEFSNHGGDEFATNPQTEEASELTVYWMFELDSYNGDLDTNNPSKTDYWILTPENIEIIIKYEDMVIGDDTDWTNYYCYVTNTTTYDCEYTSLARQVAERWNYDYSNMTSEEIKEYILDLYWYTSDTPGTIESSFNKGFADTNQTYIYRSFLSVGLPITSNINITYDSESGEIIKIYKTSEYRNDNDEYEDQVDEYNKWADDLWEDITVDHNSKFKDGNLRVVYYVATVYSDYFNLLLMQSMVYVIAALACVLIWITVHLRSIFLSSLALVQIILSFPFAYFIYYYICGITHFDTLSLLIIFVLLGVGADNLFVLTDNWRHSVYYVNAENLEERMTFTYRRGVTAISITQATTIMAFLSTATATIMPIAAFGFWSSLIVLCNFILVITLYPALILIHHHYIKPFEEKYCCFCCNSNNNNSDDDDVKTKKTNDTDNKDTHYVRTPSDDHDDDIDVEYAIELGEKKKSNFDFNNNINNIPPKLEKHVKSVEEESVNYGCLEKFFALTWATWINKFRIVVLILFATLFSIVIWRASLLEEQDEDEAFFSNNHYMQQTEDLANSFSASQESGLVYVSTVFGVQGLKRTGSRWDTTKYGKVKWDNDFDISSNESQQYLYDSCVELQESDLAFQASSVFCPMSYFKNYLESIDEEFPYIYTNTYDNDTNIEYDSEMQSEMFNKMIYNFTKSNFALILNQYSLIFIESIDDDDNNELELILRYIAIGAFTSSAKDDSLTDGRKFQDDWYNWLDETFNKNDDCPDGLRNGQSSSYHWCWMRTNREFILSALQGIAIALPLAFVVLLISTQNWIMAIFATLDIIGVMACELGIMEMMGWQFGISESVAIVIVIGFSVDYVVHLANAYLECPSGVRSERISFSLLTMGISVVSGAITTLLAGICLTFPEVTFFFKMGILIITTICFSLAWSMLFFIALLATFGPQFETGHIPFEKIPFHKIKSLLGQNQESEQQEKYKD